MRSRLFSELSVVSRAGFDLGLPGHCQSPISDLTTWALLPRPYSPDPSVHGIDERKHEKCEPNQQECRLIRGRIVGCLHLVVDVNGNSPSHAWDIATHHQHDAEFAHCV